MIGAPHLILALVVAQRLAELVLAGRNTRRLKAAGAMERGAAHYPLFVLLHGSWLLALFALVPADSPVNWPLIAVFALLQAGRIWVIATLGRFWTTRIITLPDAPLVTGGPFRYCRHPNYLVVAGEIAVLPLAFGLWPLALLYSLLNALLIAYRIRIEEDALADRRPHG